MSHELTMKQNNEEKARKRKTIALKSTSKDEEDSGKLEEGEEDEDMTHHPRI